MEIELVKFYDLEDLQKAVSNVRYPWVEQRKREDGAIWLMKVDHSQVLFEVRVDESLQAEVTAGGMFNLFIHYSCIQCQSERHFLTREEGTCHQ